MNSCERLYSAAIELTGAGPIKQRLVGAYVRHLEDLSEEQLPTEIRDEFGALKRALCAVKPMPGEPPVRATVRKMSDDEASRYASQIVHLFSAATRAQSRRANALVPLYAAEG